MKTTFFNTIYKINLVWYIITLVLFISIYLGFLAEFVLGIMQIITALFLLFHWNSFSDLIKQRLQIYWTVVIIFFTVFFSSLSFIDDFIMIIGISVIPMFIGAYFLNILYKIKINLLEKYDIAKA